MARVADPKRILLVTGLSGAGKSTVLRTLEDLGWGLFCVRVLGVSGGVEVAGEGMGGLVAYPAVSGRLVAGVREAGFRFVCVDLEGFGCGVF